MPSRRFVLGLVLSCCVVLPAHAAVIHDYAATFIPGRLQDGGPLMLAIRTLTRNGVPHFLTVDTYSLETALTPAATFLARDNSKPGYIALAELEASPYWRTLQHTTQAPQASQNHGLTHAMRPSSAHFLTVDMCPSRRATELPMLEALAARRDGAVPVAICMTGVWLLTHAVDMQWLQEQVALGRLDITWVNHSFSHIYFPDLSMEDNFLVRPEIHLRHELLETERQLLALDAMPSVFVRFPGLIADATVIDEARHLGLIPVGSDAWLAKGQVPTAGSIILVHGNGNEPQGIEALMPMLRLETVEWRGLRDAVLP